VIVVPPGGGEVVGDAPDRRVEILSDHDALTVTWSRFGPGREGADLHVHYHHTDLFYVLEGELTVRLGVEDELVSARAGTLVRIPPLVVHGFRNASAADVKYLNLHAPGAGFADYMRKISDFDQFDPPADGVRPTSEVGIGRPGELADGPELAASEVAAPFERESQDALQAAYVLDGERVGTWLQAPPGTPLEVDGDGRLLLLRAPG